jgi:hypothetical protein
MQWIAPSENGEDDPSGSEITGFTASLCMAGIPRVLACPWICYDLPVCHLIPKIVKNAIEKRGKAEPHYWARALADTVRNRLKPEYQIGFGLYDLANLMLFGAP